MLTIFSMLLAMEAPGSLEQPNAAKKYEALQTADTPIKKLLQYSIYSEDPESFEGIMCTIFGSLTVNLDEKA